MVINGMNDTTPIAIQHSLWFSFVCLQFQDLCHKLTDVWVGNFLIKLACSIISEPGTTTKLCNLAQADWLAAPLAGSVVNAVFVMTWQGKTDTVQAEWIIPSFIFHEWCILLPWLCVKFWRCMSRERDALKCQQWYEHLEVHNTGATIRATERDWYDDNMVCVPAHVWISLLSDIRSRWKKMFTLYLITQHNTLFQMDTKDVSSELSYPYLMRTTL